MLSFLIDDLEVGLLKNKRVGMLRRTLKFKVLDNKRYSVFDEFIYLPYFRSFVVLRVKGRFEQ